MNYSTPAAKSILSNVERDPAEVRHWRQLLILCFDQKDIETLQTLQTILTGIEQIWNRRRQKAKEAHDIARQRQRSTGTNEPLPPLAVLSISLSARQKESLIKLVHNPQSPALLYRFGLQLEEEFDLPTSAHGLYERALALQPKEEQLEQKLVDALTRLHAATREAPKEVSHTGGILSPEPMGVKSPTHQRPSTSSLFKRTGRLSVDRSRIQTSSGKLSEQEWTESQKRLDDTMSRIQAHAATVCETAPRPMRLPRSIAPLQWLEFLQDHLTLLIATIEAQDVEIKLTVDPQQLPASDVKERSDLLMQLMEEIDQSLSAFRPASRGITPVSEEAFDIDRIAEVFDKIEAGDLPEAEKLLRQLEKESLGEEQLSETWFHLGLAYQKEEMGKHAIAAYQRACDLNSKNLQAWFNSGMIMHEEGMLRPAHDCYVHAADIDPSEPKIWCNLGVLQFQLGEFEASVASLNKAVNLRPDYARAWDNLAGSLCAVDQLSEAERCCHRAINFKSDYADPQFKLGSIYFQQSRWTEAEKALNSVLQLQPGYPLAGHYLAMVLARADRLEEAVAMCDMATVPTGETELPALAWNELGYHLYEKGSYAEALSCYKKALTFTPERAITWLDAGVTLHQMGEVNEARAHYQRAITFDPELARAWHNLGAVRQEMGDRPGAKEAFAEAEKLLAGKR